jgi:cysteine desulfurase
MDYAATTPVDQRVAEKMAECLTMDGVFGNPASKTHSYGWMAAELVDIARTQIADLIGADHREIIFTSGATESDNTAIKGTAAALSDRGNHIITSSVEHKAVIDTCRFLETRGFQVTYLKPDKTGAVSPQQVEEAVTDKTILVSIMHVNNEVGTVNDIAGISQVCRNHGILLHSDAAQSLGKEKIDVSELGVDMLSLSAHKIYGPKGIGALYIRRSPDVKPVPLMHGGGHERGFRSGTLPTHQIVGMGEACRILSECFDEETSRIRKLRDELQRKLLTLPKVRLNGGGDHRVCGILNLNFGGVDGEMLISNLKDVAVSTGSACTSASVEPSYVLTQIGVPRELAYSSIRFSLGRFTRSEDVDFVFRAVTRVLAALR